MSPPSLLQKFPFLHKCADAWGTTDPRLLGLFRIALGFLCFVDTARRLPQVVLMYSDEGVLTNKAILAGKFSKYTFSLLLSLGTPAEALVFFWGTIVCSLLFMVGYRTKLFQVLTAIGILSIHNKNILVENGGDQVMNIYLVWSLFLPLGQRFGIDALRASWAKTESGPQDLNDGGFLGQSATIFRSLAVFACHCQLACIYLFNALNKGGKTWSGGSALHYLVNMDRQVTSLGYWMQGNMPLWMSKLGSWGTLALEGALPLLILLPGPLFWSRLVAFAFVIILHGSIAAMMNVGVFSFIMMVAGILVLRAEHLDWLAARLRPLWGPPIVVFYDADCGVCHTTARLFRRLDLCGLMTFASASHEGPKPANLGKLLDSTIVVFDPESRRAWTRHEAFARMARAVPFAAPLGWVLQVPGISTLAGAAYDAFAARRARVSVWLGHAACGVSPSPRAKAPDAPPSPAALAWLRTKARSRDALVAVLGFGCFLQALTTNEAADMLVKPLNAWLKSHDSPVTVSQIPSMGVAITYLRMFQKWNMFAPNVPTTEGWLVISATTADGRHLDPQTGRAPDFGTVRFGGGVDFGQCWRIYTKRIVLDRYKRFRPDLEKYLLNRHRVLGLPSEDRLTQFEVFWVTDKSPPPGSKEGPKPNKKERILSHGTPKAGAADAEKPESAPTETPSFRRAERPKEQATEAPATDAPSADTPSEETDAPDAPEAHAADGPSSD